MVTVETKAGLVFLSYGQFGDVTLLSGSTLSDAQQELPRVLSGERPWFATYGRDLVLYKRPDGYLITLAGRDCKMAAAEAEQLVTSMLNA